MSAKGLVHAAQLLFFKSPGHRGACPRPRWGARLVEWVGSGEFAGIFFSEICLKIAQPETKKVIFGFF